MEIVFSILKQLSAMMSPLELLLIVALIAISILMSVRYIAKVPKSGIIGLLTGQEEKPDKISDLTKKFEDFVSNASTKTELQNSIAEVKQLITVGLTELINGSRLNDENMDDHLQHNNDMRAEFGKTLGLIQKLIDDMLHLMKMHDVHNETQFNTLRESLHRNHELMHKLISHVEKIDEYLKTTAPEFRSYHKDLTRELGQLSKDIGIMDRVLQAQINNGKSGITLR